MLIGFGIISLAAGYATHKLNKSELAHFVPLFVITGVGLLIMGCLGLYFGFNPDVYEKLNAFLETKMNQNPKRKEKQMKKKLALLLSILTLGTVFTGCDDMDTTTISNSIKNENETETEQADPITYNADFYDNNGNLWLTVEGKTFNISPNKVKTYTYSTDGSWEYNYEMSSVMSIDVDGKSIESCGSTVIFSDNRLQKADIDFDSVSTVDETNISDDVSVSIPNNLRAQDYWKLHWWWETDNLNNNSNCAKIIVVQSQLGNPIAVYTGNNVTWNVPRNLPKTTEVMIDNKPLYIHRANFAIIDADLLD